MKVLKQISVYTLLLIIIFSSLGISFYLHDCHCQKTTLVSLGTGFSGQKTFCGCSTNLSHHQKVNDVFSFGKKGCCNDHVYFFLIPVAQDNAVCYLPLISEKLLFQEIGTATYKTEQRSFVETFPLLHSPPLLLSGKQLVYLIQQIRIPFPA